MGRVKLPPAPVRGALAEAVHLARAFLVTVSGRDPTSLGTSTPNLAGGLRSVDFGVFALYALLLFAANWALRLAVIEPCARRALAARGRAPSASTVQKFAQAATEFFIYALFAFFGAMIVPSQPFAWPSANWWIGFSDGSHSVMRDDMRCYYVLYASRYAQAALSVLLEHKRKDFVEMQVHHSVTVALVGISYAYGWNRIGVIVMLLLDPADVPLHLAKMSKCVIERDATTRSRARAPRGDEAQARFALAGTCTTRACRPAARPRPAAPPRRGCSRPTGCSSSSRSPSL